MELRAPSSVYHGSGLHLPPESFGSKPAKSDHKALRNTPSIGWDNDLWALNVCTHRYTRRTTVARNEGLQHTAISEDGAWYVYPLRVTEVAGLSMFQYVKMMFGTLSVDAAGDAKLSPQFEQRLSK